MIYWIAAVLCLALALASEVLGLHGVMAAALGLAVGAAFLGAVLWLTHHHGPPHAGGPSART